MKTKDYLKSRVSDFISIFYPELCPCCSNALQESDNCVCQHCFFHFPTTDFHLHTENPITDIFLGRLEIKSATAYCYFKKGNHIQDLIHKLKYDKRGDIGVFLGKSFGDHIKNCKNFEQIDYIVPVPLHPKKEKIRSYNQSDKIGIGLSKSLNVPMIEDNLKRVVFTQSQTKKNKEERWENVKNVFSVNNPALFRDKHLLIIDDVITTGSTIEACSHILINECNAKISVGCIACTQY